MQEKTLSTLAELEYEINQLRLLILSKRKHQYQVLPIPLFRGQCAKWPLKTTLERYSDKEYSIKSYNKVLTIISSAVSSYTDRSWEIDHEPVIYVDSLFNPPNYEFMAYVRHHGFPSPLLDWTRSLYVALFFAYQNASEGELVAIYTYIESLRSMKINTVGAPIISELGPYVATHRRHFLQQGQYTVAVQQLKGNDGVYCSHELAFRDKDNEEQDILYKFTLPGALRYSVLSKLEEMNINAFTLYGNEDSLMSTLAFKEIMQRNQLSQTHEF